MIIEEVGVENLCAHCGEDCEDATISIDDSNFCCLGCKTVFEILHDNGLDAYYRLENKPGNTLKKHKQAQQYEYLDDPLVQFKILDFQDKNIAKIRLYIPSIHCSSCIWLLENLYKLKSGVLVSQVDFPKKITSIDYDPSKTSLREIVETISVLGYAPEITLEKAPDQQRKVSKKQRELLVKIGVAGFSFGNIMLFSFPDYLGMDRLIDPAFSSVFGFVSFLFALPVIFYSGRDYFKASFQSLRQRIVSIDVPIALGISALFLRSAYEVISATGTGYFDSLAGLVFFLLLGRWFQGKTYENLLFERNYKSYFPIAITKIQPEKLQSIPISELLPKDRILVRNNELVPADCILISDAASIDNSFVTGESDPISVNKGGYIYAGGRQMGSGIELEVQKEVSQSYLTQLWNNDAFKKENRHEILINQVSKYFTLVVLLLALVTSVYWYFADPTKILNSFTAVLIVACPCALALSTPFAVGNSMRILGKSGIFLKNGHVVEVLANINKIVFDKTGTISHQSDAKEITFDGKLTQEEAKWVSSLASNSIHPLSRMIRKKIGSNGTQLSETLDFHEEKGKGISGSVSGNRVQIGSAAFTGTEDSSTHETSKVMVLINGIFKGTFHIQSSFRIGLEELLATLAINYPMMVLSGDNASDKNYLKEIFPINTKLYFNQTAYDKLEEVKIKQKEGNVVMMVGDGLNDSGALAQSDVGVAITDNTNNFTPASDIIFSGNQISKLPGMLSFAKGTKRIIIISFILSFLYNIVGLSYAVSGLLTPIFAAILMPFSSISVVVFVTLATRIAATKNGFK